MNEFERVKQLHLSAGLEIGKLSEIPKYQLIEELQELLSVRDESLDKSLIKLSKSWTIENICEVSQDMAQALILLCGIACYLGIPLDKVFDEVCRAEEKEVKGNISIEPEIFPIIAQAFTDDMDARNDRPSVKGVFN